MKRRYKLCVMIVVFAAMTVYMMFPASAAQAWFNSMIDSLVERVEELLGAAFVGIFQIVSMLLLGALDVNGGELDPGGMVSAHPATWNGGQPWRMVAAITNSAIVPVAMTVLMIILVVDLIQMLTAGNQFEQVGIGAWVKWTVKVFVGITLVTNIYNIASAIFVYGVSAGISGVNTLNEMSIPATTCINLIADIFGIGFLLLMIFIAVLVLIGVIVLIISILITLAGRMIDIFMYLSVSPLTAATMMNSDWKNIGQNWLKGMVALAFQGFFVIVAIAVFTGIYLHVIDLINATGTREGVKALDVINAMLMLLAYTFALVMTIFRSGSISKSIFGAH